LLIRVEKHNYSTGGCFLIRDSLSFFGEITSMQFMLILDKHKIIIGVLEKSSALMLLLN